MTPELLLADLRLALRQGTLLHWTAAHAAAHDPVPAAWAACGDDGLMLWFLALLRHPDHDALSAFCSPRCEDGPCRRCADAVRAALPTLTLDAVRAAPVAGHA